MLAYYDNKKRYNVRKSHLLIYYDFCGTIEDVETNCMMKKITSIEFEVIDCHLRYSKINVQLFLWKNLQSLSLSYTFNKPLVPNKKLKRLIFNGVFDQELTLSKNILIVRFNFPEQSSFNRPIILNKRIIELRLNYRYNQPIILTKNLKRLTLGLWYRYKLHIETHMDSLNMYSLRSERWLIDNFPNCITEIRINDQRICPHKCIFIKNPTLLINSTNLNKTFTPMKWTLAH